MFEETGNTVETSELAQKTILRQQGRPTGPVTGDIRQAILDSAELRFAQQGYAATSLREIAEEVGVTPAMIHYYFGSKQALLQQVLERVLEPLAAAIASMKTADQAPVSKIVGILLRTFSSHPNLPFLVAREVLLPGGAMQGHFLEYLAPRLGGAVPGLLAKEQAAGRMQPDLDPEYSALTLLSLCAFPFIARNLSEPVLSISYDQAGLVKLERHITRLLDKGYSL